ncbi:MAG: hypothetical protein JW751_22870 [Polyangiaceae bacterium]|nr:hypothetical protein [Polyangiaceae bacterium]
MSRRWVALLAVAPVLCAGSPAIADEARAVLLPTTVVTDPSPIARPRRDPDQDAARLGDAAHELDRVLEEAVQDLGLTLELDAASRSTTGTAEADLVSTVRTAWIIAPEVALERGALVVRIAAVAPGSKVVLSRRERVDLDALEVTAMHLLRDVVDAGNGQQASPPAPSPVLAQPAGRTHSAGRTILALHGTALGGYAGYSVQRASGSNDARLTYPLTALGAGIGLGASMIVSEEWELGVGDAWYLAAGGYWPGAAGLLLARGYDVEPSGDRYLYGLIGASGGISLAAVGLAFGHIEGGGATLAHTGGAFGTALGGLVQAGIAGTTRDPLYLGLGYGAIAGAVVGGVAGTQYHGSSTRVLFIDLLAGLGGLGGAALGSSLMVGDEQTPAETRGWIACIAAGTVTGAAVGIFATRPRSQSAGAPPTTSVLPYGGVIAEGTSVDAPPFLGAGIQGMF